LAQFDVRRLDDDLVLDCQADLLDHIETRFVVPLLPAGAATIASGRLNPSLEVGGETYVMVTQAAAAVDRRELGPVVATLADRSFEITGAIDVLISGV